MSLTKAIVDTRVVQDAFAGGGLAGIDVRHYADITGFE
jgi:hypothetical protein